jgi:hypothetical protein
MNARELRIGNLYDYHGVPKKVTPSVIEDVWEAQREWCKPIPLTRESLLMFMGWTEYTADDYGELLGWSNGCFFIDQWFQLRFEVGVIKIDYVHQLQNIYFALTGEELTLTASDGITE